MPNGGGFTFHIPLGQPAADIMRKRPGTAEDYRRMLRVWVRPHFGEHAKVRDVDFADIDRLHRRITNAGYSYRANRVIAVVSKMFSLAVRWGMRETNPTRGFERNREYGRRRYLSADELVRLTKALAEHPDKQTADVIRLLLLTGARRGEKCLPCAGPTFDLAEGTWSKPASSTKQREAQRSALKRTGAAAAERDT